ncbi:3-hydroxyacyl-CoA dehydrogenase [Aureimonas sp. SK2]|uniref:3-hydroxyacyl-CoA dehydrogenase n=1 Tax=Aureimonas sp. SK2 TaxID=3015992 RepID=UPI002444DE30|nr:3-hydroxyacyl-CoA dehydrogenase [Aureimonas sp. SK2]
MKRIAIVGCGTVGASWALVFARAGLEVMLFDEAPGAADRAHESVRGRLDADGGPMTAKITVADCLERAVADCDYVQESAPERLEIKRPLHQRLDTLVPPTAIVASSTSGFPASAFTEPLAHRRRCLVVHPINPPHLIPLVEIVPAPWTDPSVVERSAALMRDVGQSPVRLSREINGFLVNRLQSAILGEAFRLVEDGICSVDDVDRAVSDGLGLRWFFMGPFETIDLNAREGIAEYCRNLGPMYRTLAEEQADPRDWSETLVADVERQRRLYTKADDLAARRQWRDRCLTLLVEAKRQALGNAAAGGGKPTDL